MSDQETQPNEPRTSAPRKKLVFRLALVLGAVVLLLGAVGYLLADMLRTQPGPHLEPVMVIIEPGDGRTVIKHKLVRSGVISHPLHLDVVVWMTDVEFRPQAGEYRLPASASLEQILRQFNTGQVHQRRMTIIEGWRSYEVMQALNDAPGLNSVILRPPEEGSVYPDTYYYTYGTDRRDLLLRMQEKMDITLAEIWANRQEDLPYKDARDLLIMASIIEKETGKANERARIGGVFVNRLRKSMRLQSDPTVAYGLAKGAVLPQRLSHADLQRHHGWNTYKNKGLPVGPIANPGSDALLAAAHPEDTDYLYFVADGQGGHNFAKTLDEHNRNVRTYRQRNKQGVEK